MGVWTASGPGPGSDGAARGLGGVFERTEVVRAAVVLMWWVPAGLWTVSVTGIWTVVKPLAEPPG